MVENKLRYDSLEIGVTAACQMRCLYCGVNNKPIVPYGGKVDNFISTIHALDIIEPETDGFISITGGEPMLAQRNTKKLIEGIREYFPEKELVLNTNGCIYNEKIFDLVDILHISVNEIYINKMDDTHFVNFRRPNKNALDCFYNINKTLTSKYPKTIETILTKYIIDNDLIDLYNYIKTIPNVQLYEISVMTPMIPEHWDIFLTEKRLADVLYRFFGSYDKKIPIRINCCYLNKMGWEDYIRQCPEGVDRIHIDINGNLSICDIADRHSLGGYGNIYKPETIKYDALYLYQKMSPCIGQCQGLRMKYGKEFQNMMKSGARNN